MSVMAFMIVRVRTEADKSGAVNDVQIDRWLTAAAPGLPYIRDIDSTQTHKVLSHGKGNVILLHGR